MDETELDKSDGVQEIETFSNEFDQIVSDLGERRKRLLDILK
ncbi:MAG: hypothetical protein PHH98_03920 [Candidatus Gracilibacteria bacterium]|nr:hypothetical protein [Candidatus Gracilibacteria bacterium]